MKKVLFAMMIATSVMSATFANAQTEVKTAPAAQQKTVKTVHKTQVKKVDKNTAAPTTKMKTMSKTEKTTTTSVK